MTLPPEETKDDIERCRFKDEDGHRCFKRALESYYCAVHAEEVARQMWGNP